MNIYGYLFERIAELIDKLRVTSPLGISYLNLIAGFALIQVIWFFVTKLLNVKISKSGSSVSGADNIKKVKK